MEIIKYDIKGRLLLHPYITSKVAERLRVVGINLAKAARVSFGSLMSQPDEYFKKYEITDANDKTTFIEKVFCAPSMPPGEYIVFCNPMRHWGDCQLWINRHEGTYARATNVMAASTKLMLSLGETLMGILFNSSHPKSIPISEMRSPNLINPQRSKNFLKWRCPELSNKSPSTA